jgi:hypothetical protein
MLGLIATFKAALDAFNDASTPGNYNAVGPFLDSNVVLEHVDDPSYICGTPTAILHYLNSTQIGLWPYLDYLTPHPPTYFNNPAGQLIGTVTGSGTYQDKTTSNPFAVTYRFIFRRNTAGYWLLTTALAHP